MNTARTTAEVAAAVGEDEWQRRLKEAQDEAEVLALARVRAGESRSAALRALLPDRPVASTLRRLCRLEQGGREGLLDLHVPVRPALKMDEHARGALRALARCARRRSSRLSASSGWRGHEGARPTTGGPLDPAPRKSLRS